MTLSECLYNNTQQKSTYIILLIDKTIKRKLTYSIALQAICICQKVLNKKKRPKPLFVIRKIIYVSLIFLRSHGSVRCLYDEGSQAYYDVDQLILKDHDGNDDLFCALLNALLSIQCG